MAVALIAQSAAGDVECPALTASKVMVMSTTILCIAEPPDARQYAPLPVIEQGIISLGVERSVGAKGCAKSSATPPAAPRHRQPAWQRSSGADPLSRAGK